MWGKATACKPTFEPVHKELGTAGGVLDPQHSAPGP